MLPTRFAEPPPSPFSAALFPGGISLQEAWRLFNGIS